MSTIGVTVNQPDDVEFAANAAAGLVKWLIAKEPLSTGNEDTPLVAGIFTMCAANVYSLSVAASFEMSASLALFILYGTDDLDAFGELHEEIVESFNLATNSRSKVVERVGQAIANWSKEPSTANADRLRLVFRVLLADEPRT